MKFQGLGNVGGERREKGQTAAESERSQKGQCVCVPLLMFRFPLRNVCSASNNRPPLELIALKF